ncbi:MAG: hypothetical protein WBP41_19325 [Saprospiraceae bacterium]
MLAVISLVTFVLLSFYGIFEHHYSTKEVIENYNKRKDAITELTNYFNTIRPLNNRIKIEFQGKNHISKFDIRIQETFKMYANIKVDSPIMDTLLKAAGWNKTNLTELYQKLKKANCISIQSNYYMPGENSCEVGFQKSDMGIYYYQLFEPPLEDSLKARFNDGCKQLLINNSAAISWYGGTVGAECLDGKERIRE